MSPTRTRTVDHATLVLDRRLGQGGQGTVYLVTNKKISTDGGAGWDAVYKEYSAAVLPGLDAGALASMVNLLSERSREEGRWLCEKAAWPAAVVERQGHACGFLMRAVPDRFQFVLPGLAAGSAGSTRLANLEYLLNDDAYVASIGLKISDRTRLLLLADVAATLARLHRIGIAVGDLSPKNLLFSTDSQPECFVIDCDAMRLRGATVLPQAETPDWQVPAGQEKATQASDVYKLGLLAIRLFARDQTATDPAALTAIDPALGNLARSSLDADPAQRPTFDLWAEQLSAAIPTASTAPAAATATAPKPGGRPAASPNGTQRPPWNLAGPRGFGLGGVPLRTKVHAGLAAAVAVILLFAFARAHDSQSSSTSNSEGQAAATSGGGAHLGGGALPAWTPDTPADRYSPTPVPDETSDEPSPPDPIEDAEVGSCFYENGSGDDVDLVSTDCTPGAFKVVRIFTDTTDLDSCDDVTDNDESVSSARHDLVLCLSYLSPGGTAYHARQGDCVYGRHSTGPWSTQSCQTGNFTVLAVYKGTTDNTKCRSWPRYNQWKTFTVDGESRLDTLLCLSMNYPDDAGYATINQCLLMSGSNSHRSFTNVGSCAASNVVVTGRTSTYNASAFCGRDGSMTWRPTEFPDLAYTVCWRWR